MLTWRRRYGTGTLTKCKGQLPGAREALTWTWWQERIDERTEDQGQTIVLKRHKVRGNYKGEFGGGEGQLCVVSAGTVLLDWPVLLVLPELLYTPGGSQRRVAGSREEARSSGEVLCSCGGRAGWPGAARSIRTALCNAYSWLQVELKGGRIDWRAIVESRSGRGEERIVTCALHTSPLCLGRPDRKEKKTSVQRK